MPYEDWRFCAQTAFRYHRIPPQLLALYPPLPNTYGDSNHLKFAKHETVTDLLGTPLHRLTNSDRQRANSVLYRTHVLREEAPFGSMQSTEHNFAVASPLYTLLTIAPMVTRIELLMIAYELCGSFSVFEPCKRADTILRSAYSQGIIKLGVGWTRVRNTRGEQTNLWKREPLITIDELKSYAAETSGMYGAKKLQWVAQRLTGECASPFEVQASILLGLSRRLGGMGFAFSNNRRIRLTNTAKEFYRHNSCYADLYIEGSRTHPPVDIECQGQSVHDSEEASLSDSDRIAALESMGIQVVPLTYRQISSEDNLEATGNLIARKLNIQLKPKTERQKKAQQELLNVVLTDWERLGAP